MLKPVDTITTGIRWEEVEVQGQRKVFLNDYNLATCKAELIVKRYLNYILW